MIKQFKKSQFVKDLNYLYDELKIYFGFKRRFIGCGTGTLPDSECHKKLIFQNITIDPKSTKECEILAGRSGAFKVRKMQILVKETQNLNCYASVEIGKIRGYDDIPQTMNYSGEKGLSDVFKEPVDVDFNLIGSGKGEGLRIQFHNHNDSQVNVYISIWGDAATMNLLGKA